MITLFVTLLGLLGGAGLYALVQYHVHKVEPTLRPRMTLAEEASYEIKRR